MVCFSVTAHMAVAFAFSVLVRETSLTSTFHFLVKINTSVISPRFINSSEALLRHVAVYDEDGVDLRCLACQLTLGLHSGSLVMNHGLGDRLYYYDFTG